MVIFLRRCPFRCLYCQNHDLLEGDNYVEMQGLEEDINKIFLDIKAPLSDKKLYTKLTKYSNILPVQRKWNT